MRVDWLGQVDYDVALALQNDLAERRRAGLAGDVLLLLEHPPTVTLGRRSDAAHVLASPEVLNSAGVCVRTVDRGGDVTYHGPGQLVGYPVFDLTHHGRDLHGFLRRIEGALISALAELDIIACRFPPHTGVWVGDRKIAAIGIHVSRWVSTHGFALNVRNDLAGFRHIVPCGIHDYGVTSVAMELGRTVEIDEVRECVESAFIAEFGGAFEPVHTNPRGAGTVT